MRRLIVNADDFGLTSGVNRAIVDAHERGIVTSSTLMANGAAFLDATQLQPSVPKLSVGCHVVLVDGSPVSTAGEVPSLTNGNGQFHSSLSQFAALAVRGRLDPSQIEREAGAQIRKIQESGIQVSHLDTHKHTHMFPQVLRPLLSAARSCGVPAIRNPFESVKLWQLFKDPNSWTRWLEVRTLHTLAAGFRRAVRDAGLVTTDGTLGIVATGTLGQRVLQFLLEHLPEGTRELVCHPGYNDAELRSVRTRLRESREIELRLLTSPETRQWLSAGGIELISYRELASGRPSS